MRHPDFPLFEHLKELENAQLVRQATESELTYLFKHALTQETVYQSLLKTRRADLHRRVAEVIEQLFGDQLDQNAAILYLHYEQAGLNDKAFRYAVRAGQRAARAFAHIEALTFFDRALRLASILVAQDRDRELTLDIRLVFVQKGRVFEVMGNPSAAEENYRAMIEFAQKIGDAAMEAEGLNALVTAQVVRSGPTPETDSQLERAFALAQQAEDSELIARTLWTRGLAYRFPDPPRATDDFMRALALAEAGSLRQLAAYVRLDLHVALALQGRARQARHYAQRALADFRALDLKPMIADALEALAYHAYTRAEPTQGRALAEEGLRLSQTIENPWGVLNNQIELLVLDLAAGHLTHVLREGEAILAATRQLGVPPFSLGSYSLLTQACLQLNQLERARAWADEAVEAFGGDEGDHFALWGTWLQAIVLIKGGELARAHMRLSPLMQRNSFPVAPFDRYGWVGQTLAELALLENRLDDGLERCNRLLRGVEEEEVGGLAAGMYYWRAKIYHARSDLTHAEEDAIRARELLEQAENRILLWRAELLLSDISQELGKDAAALNWRVRASALTQYIAEHSPFELREDFLASEQVRRVTRK